MRSSFVGGDEDLDVQPLNSGETKLGLIDYSYVVSIGMQWWGINNHTLPCRMMQKQNETQNRQS